MGDQLDIFGTPQQALRHHVTGAIQRGEKVAIVAKPAEGLASVERQRISGKRVKEMEGRVIRLLAVNPKDWFPHGILVGRDNDDWILNHFMGGYLGQLRLPRTEYMGVEEIDIHPDAYAKRGL